MVSKNSKFYKMMYQSTYKPSARLGSVAVKKNAVKHYGRWVRLAILILFVGCAAYFVRQGFGFEQIRAFIEGFGIWSWLAFIIIYGIAMVFLVPGTILTVIGGILFGIVGGTVVNVLGATLGATLAFTVSRYLGQEAVQFLVRGRIKTLQKKVRENAFESIIGIRLLPIFPFNVLNYGFGLTTVKASTHTFATFLGIIPGTFVYTYAAAVLGELLLMEGIGALSLSDLKSLILPVLLLLLLIIGSTLWRRKKRSA